MIEFVYFDIGGVLVFDFSKTDKWKNLHTAMGIDPSRLDDFSAWYMAMNMDICRGKVNIQDLAPEIRREYAPSLPDDFDYLSEFVNRFEPNQNLQKIAKAVSANRRVGQLTNMYIGMLDMIDTRAMIDSSIEWDAVVDSSKVHQAKPDPAIYGIAEQHAGVEPHKILFIDNAQENLKPAIARGWQTLLYDPADPESSNTQLAHMLDLEENTG